MITWDDHLLVKDGPTTAAWDHVGSWLKSYRLERDTIAVHTFDDRLLVKYGPTGAGWDHVFSWHKSYQIEGDRLAVHTLEDRLLVRDGPTGAPFVEVANSPKSYQLDGDRIAVHTHDDRLLIKDGPLDAKLKSNSTDRTDATRRLRDTLRDTRRGVKYGPNRPAAGQEMALQHGRAPSDGLTGNVEGLVRDNRVEVRVLFGA